MKYIKYYLAFAVILMFYPNSEMIFGQYFGKNKVQYKNFKWYYIQSRHFDIYFYKGGEKLAEFAAEIAEESLIQIENNWKYKLKSRFPIIVYNSHNDFQQTNVVEAYLEEGVGGVTEIFKNRVTLPYEGSYGKFKHVIRHELVHAVMFDMLYGNTYPRSIYSDSMFQIPLWIAEGLAEYESIGWNTDTDMYNRDATINGYLQYSGQVYNPYWGGNLIFNFIANKYGKEKVREFLRSLKNVNNIDRAIKYTFGVDHKEFAEQWSLYARRRYWPDIVYRKKSEEFAIRLSNHSKINNIYNISPSISPSGSEVAFISDKSGHLDVYIMSTIDGKILDKVIKGERSPAFEEMHLLFPGISWSPDGENIALAAKSGEEDALYIINVKSKKNRQLKFGLDGLFNPAWSPSGNQIAFVGNKNGASDIYSFNINTKELRKITDDAFSDKHPSWSPNGEKIAFVSDRKNYINKEMIPEDFKMYEFDFSQSDIYIVDEDGVNMQRITETDYNEDYPVWSPDGEFLAHTSEKNGITNIFITDINSTVSKPITNTLTGCMQLSWSKDGSKLVFVSFYKIGYDIFMIKNPLDIDSKNIQLKNTVYFDQLEKKKKEKYPKNLIAFDSKTGYKSKFLNLSKYIYDVNYKEQNESIRIEQKKAKKEITKYESELNVKNNYKIKKYKLKFSSDVITGSAGYDKFYGLQGTNMIQITDVLGNHQILIGTDLYVDLKNSNFSFFYNYLPRRTNYSIGIFQYTSYFTGYNQFLGLPIDSVPFRLRNFGVRTIGSRPFSKFSRIDFSASYSILDQTYFNDSGYIPIPSHGINSLRFSLSYSKDISLWGPNFFPIIPLDGTRYYFSISTSPPLSNNSFSPYLNGPDTNGTLSFTTAITDIRKYFRIGNLYGFGLRLSGGVSFGRDPENFYLGGVDNWINRQFAGDVRDGLRDIFFSKFITPLRGADYYQLVGSKFFLSNVEFRFPLIQYLQLGWPLPIGFQHIRGSLFMDIGGAWDPYEEFNIVTGKWVVGDPFRKDYETHKGFRAIKKVNNVTYFDDMAASFGIGARGVLLFMLARIDVAWLFNGNRFSAPNYLFSIGLDF